MVRGGQLLRGSDTPAIRTRVPKQLDIPAISTRDPFSLSKEAKSHPSPINRTEESGRPGLCPVNPWIARDFTRPVIISLHQPQQQSTPMSWTKTRIWALSCFLRGRRHSSSASGASFAYGPRCQRARIVRCSASRRGTTCTPAG